MIIKLPNKEVLNQWKIFYFLGTLIFFIFTLLVLFLQKQDIRDSYLYQHANDLEYQKDYHNAFRIWKKLYEKNHEEVYYLIKMIQNLLLQENYHEILKTIDKYKQQVYDSDTLLILLKYGLFVSRQLKNDKLSQNYIKQINQNLKIDVYWDTYSNKWFYYDTQFSIKKLKKWVDTMYSLLDGEVSLHVVVKDVETPFYYYSATITFNKKLFLENEQYEYIPFSASSRINVSEFYFQNSLQRLGFLLCTLKRVHFDNNLWLNQFKNELLTLSPNEVLSFLKEAKVILPARYQNKSYVFSNDFDKLPVYILQILHNKLKNLKNPEEMEGLSNVLIYLRTKIALK